jgi:triacylglycerol esterase/lipase EstA (alpha/beta hydrolase family)
MIKWLTYGYFVLGPIALQANSVYCIHGFMRSANSMKFIGASLEKAGYKPHLFGYPSRDGTIFDHSILLVESLKQEALLHPGKPIHFVTHSMGGIVLRAAINHPECPKEAKIGRAVLLSPPNQGSLFGQFLNKFTLIKNYVGPYAGKELLTEKNFNHFGDFPRSMKVFVISGTLGLNPTIKEANDGKVGVQEARLNTLHEHCTIFASHSWMIYSITTIKKATLFIIGGEL